MKSFMYANSSQGNNRVLDIEFQQQLKLRYLNFPRPIYFLSVDWLDDVVSVSCYRNNSKQSSKQQTKMKKNNKRITRSKQSACTLMEGNILGKNKCGKRTMFIFTRGMFISISLHSFVCVRKKKKMWGDDYEKFLSITAHQITFNTNHVPRKHSKQDLM